MTAPTRNFIAPAAYVQGPGVMLEAARHFEALAGGRAALLGGDTALATTGDRLTSELDAAGIDVVAVERGVDECTFPLVEEYASRVREVDADVVVGVGGGVAIDVATAVADAVGTEFVSVPTIASTDAPCSVVGVVYDDGGDFVETITRDRNPELVLVDTRAIADAPARFLAHGMGDALATRFEAEAVAASEAETVAGGRSSRAALALARECFDRVRTDGAAALAAVERDAVTPAVERIVEANVLLSGLGFESAGTAGAHAVQIGLTNVGVREPHGVLVGFGTVAQLVLEGRDRELIETVRDLVVDLGLGTTLDELDLPADRVEAAGELACENGMERMPTSVTPRMVVDAMRTADRLLAE
jgi:glycerol dehydrogenase